MDNIKLNMLRTINEYRKTLFFKPELVYENGELKTKATPSGVVLFLEQFEITLYKPRGLDVDLKNGFFSIENFLKSKNLKNIDFYGTNIDLSSVAGWIPYEKTRKTCVFVSRANLEFIDDIKECVENGHILYTSSNLPFFEGQKPLIKVDKRTQIITPIYYKSDFSFEYMSDKIEENIDERDVINKLYQESTEKTEILTEKEYEVFSRF